MKQAAIFIFWVLLSACTYSSSEAQTTVYITKTGAKYHVSTCQYLRRSKFSIDLPDAIEQGYTPCSVCGPPEISDEESEPIIQNTGVPASGGSTGSTTIVKKQKMKKNIVTSSGCTALTKAGTRCKRSASSNGRCWQHQ